MLNYLKNSVNQHIQGVFHQHYVDHLVQITKR